MRCWRILPQGTAASLMGKGSSWAVSDRAYVEERLSTGATSYQNARERSWPYNNVMALVRRLGSGSPEGVPSPKPRKALRIPEVVEALNSDPKSSGSCDNPSPQGALCAPSGSAPRTWPGASRSAEKCERASPLAPLLPAENSQETAPAGAQGLRILGREIIAPEGESQQAKQDGVGLF